MVLPLMEGIGGRHQNYYNKTFCPRGSLVCYDLVKNVSVPLNIESAPDLKILDTPLFWVHQLFSSTASLAQTYYYKNFILFSIILFSFHLIICTFANLKFGNSKIQIFLQFWIFCNIFLSYQKERERQNIHIGITKVIL